MKSFYLIWQYGMILKVEKYLRVVIQAERADGNVVIGFRPFEGGNLLATLEEFTFVSSLEQLEKIDL